MAEREVSRDVAAFAAGATWRETPEPARAAARAIVALGLAAAACRGGAALRLHAIHAGIAGDTGGAGSTVLSGLAPLPPAMAAWVNGAAAAAGDPEGRLRPHEALLPAALAAAESAGAGGEELLLGVAVGAEVALRIGGAMPGHAAAGWDPSGTVGQIGAAVAAMKVLGGDEAAALAAIGLGSAQAAGVGVSGHGFVREFAVGRAAGCGCEAGFLAIEDWRGPLLPLESPQGFFALLGGAGAEPAAALEGLGASWLLGTASGGEWRLPAGEELPRVLVQLAGGREEAAKGLLRAAGEADGRGGVEGLLRAAAALSRV